MQKSLFFHICVNKKGLVRHVITPCTFLDAHGPKEVSESKQYDLTTPRKFFRASQSERLDSLTCSFCILIPLQESFTSEKHQNNAKIACK